MKIEDLLEDGVYPATVTGNITTITTDEHLITLYNNEVWVKGVNCPCKVTIAKGIAVSSSVGEVFLKSVEPLEKPIVGKYVFVVVGDKQETLVLTKEYFDRFKRTAFLNYLDLDEYIVSLGQEK